MVFSFVGSTSSYSVSESQRSLNIRVQRDGNVDNSASVGKFENSTLLFYAINCKLKPGRSIIVLLIFLKEFGTIDRMNR